MISPAQEVFGVLKLSLSHIACFNIDAQIPCYYCPVFILSLRNTQMFCMFALMLLKETAGLK